METLPPVTLGATILVPLASFFGLRPWLEHRFVLNADTFKQVLRQFQLDVTLLIVVGCCVAAYNYLRVGFPISSAASFIFGCIVMGFFIGLDMALWRERFLIHNFKSQEAPMLPPERLYPMSHRFSVVAMSTAFFVIVVIIMVIHRDFAWLSEAGVNGSMISQAQQAVMLEVIFITAVLITLVINAIISYSKNLWLLFHNETFILEKVSRGDLSSLVPVISWDEFGLIAGHTNVMIQGLRHRSELVSSMKLAEEVQRNLLPTQPPVIAGIDLAGNSIYCKETGGDYYDYFPLSEERLAIVVADASDHGLGSAMHMTSARAFLRAAMESYEEPSGLVSMVNSYLTRDSRNSGRFMTLFFMEVDLKHRRLRWVRAGHDPALLYDPASDRVEILGGPGVVLGVSEEVVYTTRHLDGWPSGAVLVVGTDGILEARNRQGQMFGRERLIQLIKSGAHERDGAQRLLDRILSKVETFRGDRDQEDDITLVTAVLP